MKAAELIASLVAIVAKAVQEIVAAGDDRAKQEEAVMRAEEELYRVRMKQKFGPGS